jgi:hypothetical protein
MLNYLSDLIRVFRRSRPPRGEEDTPESRQRREARRVMGTPRLDARFRT